MVTPITSSVPVTCRLEQWRAGVKMHVKKYTEQLEYKGIFQALVTGDGQAITPEWWHVFNRTGTTHLMVISGLHIGLVAVGVLLVCGAVRFIGLLVQIANSADQSCTYSRRTEYGGLCCVGGDEFAGAARLVDGRSGDCVKHVGAQT